MSQKFQLGESYFSDADVPNNLEQVNYQVEH